MHLGAVDAVLTGARAVLGQAAVAIDHGRGRGADGALWASRVRAVVARAADEVVERVGHALGPAPPARGERHARRSLTCSCTCVSSTPSGTMPHFLAWFSA